MSGWLRNFSRMSLRARQKKKSAVRTFTRNLRNHTFFKTTSQHTTMRNAKAQTIEIVGDFPKFGPALSAPHMSNFNQADLDVTQCLGTVLTATLAPQDNRALMQIQGDKPETFLTKTDQTLGAGQPQELAHFDGSGGAILLALPVRVSQRAGGGSSPREMQRNRLVRALWTLLAWVLRETLSRSVMCSARVPVVSGAVRAAHRSLAKG